MRSRIHQHEPVISFTVFRISSSRGSRGGVRVKESLKQTATWWLLVIFHGFKEVDLAALCPGHSAVTYPLKATGRMWRSPLMAVQYLKCLMLVAFMESVSLNSPMPMPLQTVKEDICFIYLCWIKKAAPAQAEAWTPVTVIVNSSRLWGNPPGVGTPGRLWCSGYWNGDLGLPLSQFLLGFEVSLLFSTWTESSYS